MGIIRKKIAETQNRKAFIPALTPLGEGSDSFNIDSQSRIRTYGSKKEQLEANVGWVYAANDFIAEAFAAIEMQLYDIDKEEIIEEHEILSLIDSPNMIQTTEYTFRELYSSYMKLTGEFYALPVFLSERDALPAAIHILPPHVCDVEWGKTVQTSKVRVGNTDTYDLTELYRDIKADPRNPKNGRGVVAAAASAIDIDEKAKEYNQQFYANSARPSIVIETAEALGAQERKRFERQFNDQHTGVDSAFKPLIIEGGKVTFGMLTQKEMDFLETRKFTKDEIFAMFKVPSGLIGMTASYNRANMEAAEYNFAKYVLEPLAKRWVQMWNQSLITRYNEKTGSNLELRHVSAIPEDVKQKLEVIQRSRSILTINEQREMLGFAALPEGGDVLVYANEKLTDEDASGGATGEEAGKSLNRKKKDSDRIIAKGLSSTFDIDGEEKYFRYLEKAQRFEVGFQAQFAKIFRDQQRVIEDAVRLANLEKHYKSVEPKKRKDLLSETLDIDFAAILNPELMADSVKPIYFNLITITADMAMIDILSPVKFDPFAVDVARFYTSQARKVSKFVNETTERQLKTTLIEGLSDSETNSQLVARVQSVFNQATVHRAFDIAQTESAFTQSFADVSAWKQSGIVSGKKWYTAEDERVCVFCGNQHGREIGLETKFFKVGDKLEVDGQTLNFKYSDLQGAPLHVRCRCVLIPIRKDV